jgi:hypothetical protein
MAHLSKDKVQQAEAFIRQHSALWRHYNLRGVCDAVRQGTGVKLDENEAKSIVERIRQEGR